MRIGVDYYPEQWPETLWEKDVELMSRTGVDVVRLAEFAWCRLEPQEGEFDFEWLDSIVGMLTDRGIKIVLCTPTNCPPLWFYEKYPDAVQTEKSGKKTNIGIRGHRCFYNPDFLSYARRIIDLMTKRYGENPAVIAWQIDNELEANFCCCSTCTEHFRGWMKQKYGTVEAVNKAYGNAMWSGEYSAWEQIIPPLGSYPDAWLNPSFMLDFNRYASDSVIDHINWQAALIRKNIPDAKLTTNVWFCRNMPNFYHEFKDLDFISYDNYPTTRIPENSDEYYSHAFHLDLMRGVKQDKFWVMEQLSGGLGSWAPMSRAPYPGMIKGYALQAFAHGADTVVHFRWRTAVSGAEMHWHGLIDHSNVPGRRFEEFEQLCKTAKTLKDASDTEIKSEVAILYSPENEYAFKIQPQSGEMYYLEQLMLFHRALTRCGVNVDIISSLADLSDYRLVVAPQMYVTHPVTVEKLHAFAQNGGTVILTNRSGVKDEYNKCVMAPLPGAYEDMVGAYVAEYDPLGWDKGRMKYREKEYTCREWNDVLAAGTADTLAVYAEGFYRGKAAITRNQYGSGLVYYVGTVLGKDFYYDFIRDIFDALQIKYVRDLPDNVEIVTREGMGKFVRFIFNNTDKKTVFALDGADYSLEPFEMRIEQIND